MTMTNALDVFRRIRSNGTRDVSRRAVRRFTNSLAAKFSTAELNFPLLLSDIADSTRLSLDPPVPAEDNSPLKLAWLCTPPGPGSGGHTTLFRMVAGMEERGHHCNVLLYDRHGTDVERAARVVREHWPWLRADIRPVPDRIEGFDGCIASSWETAHVLASRARAATHRFYFIQDFEPYFYPRGSLYSLAEDTYRFGFHNVALGSMVAAALRSSIGGDAPVIPFGCDTATYRLLNSGRRHGVVFYAREAVDRRGFLLARLALEEFHRRHPEQTIHVYGDSITGWDVHHVHHGKLAPQELADLYNSCITGLAMSFTNISLVAEEMLACGMPPVVNDHAFAHADLINKHVRWAPATPGGLADALCLAVEEPSEAGAVSASARQGWSQAQERFAEIVLTEVAACRI